MQKGSEDMSLLVADKKTLDSVIRDYVSEIKSILGRDFEKAIIYGSYARGEYHEESDIDIAIFTPREAQDFYLLINNISEITFEYSVKYDVILSPVFQNINEFNRMLRVVPYYQSIEREGIIVE